MESRFVNYNCLVTYLGNLDTEQLSIGLKEYLQELPKFIELADNDISLKEYKGNQFLMINLLFYIERGLLSEDEKIQNTTKLRKELTELIMSSLKTQRVIFNIDIS